MPLMTTGEAIVESLLRHGVDTVFGIPGAHTYDLFDALHAAGDKIRFITTRHEQAGGYLAYGYAKSTGKVGVFSVVPGPGVLNAGAAMCTALGACTPVLCLTAEIPAPFIGRGRGILHELPNQLATLQSIAKWAGRINHPTEAPSAVTEAFRRMRHGRQGPVALETPWNVLGQRAEVALESPEAPAPPPPVDPDSVRQAVEIVRGARNPMITVGAGAVHAGDEVLELARLLQAPVTAHRSGRGIVSEALPYGFSGGSAIGLWMNTDVVIGIGSRLELQHIRWKTMPPKVRFVRIDIDPMEMVRLPPSAGIVADARVGTAALVEALSKVIAPRASREDEFSAAKARARAEFQKVQPQMAYLDAIRDVLPRDGFFVEEISQVGFASRFGFPVYAPRTFVTCGYQETLGFGFNTALGVKVANPHKRVISVTGDGGFMFGVQELATAIHHGIHVVTCVFNNGGFGNIRRDQLNTYGGRLIGAELTNPDFVKLAESFGAVAYRVRTPAEFRPVLEKAFADDAPVVIEVMIEPGSEASPWPFLHPTFPEET
jgi:acetolactate synthase-1/2/3 large subunit